MLERLNNIVQWNRYPVVAVATANIVPPAYKMLAPVAPAMNCLYAIAGAGSAASPMAGAKSSDTITPNALAEAENAASRMTDAQRQSSILGEDKDAQASKQ